MIERLIGDAQTRDALQRLRPSEDDLPATLARVAWSVMAEPGDGVAGALIARLGPAEALQLVLDPFAAERSASSGASGGRSAAGTAWAEGLARWRPRADPKTVRQAIEDAARLSANLLVPGDPDWPEAVDDLGDHAPAVLWVRGDTGLLTAAPRVAIVGARAATAYGEHVAAELAGDLASTGAVIVSGGAYGIDGAAHRAALGVDGATIAFLAGGVDRAYPSGHQQLLRRIAESGAVVSELPCGAAPTKWRFLARNRLIAALGEATVVVEAGWRSGSLNTAGHAASIGRPLGAVPGPITSAASAGCHRLLREYDARCVTTAEEVRELCGGPRVETDGQDRADPERTRLLDALSTRIPHTPTEIARLCGLAPERVRSLLGLLSLDGAVVQDGTGWRAATSAERRRGDG